MKCPYWAKKFWPFWLNVVAVFFKLHPTCSEEQWIGENSFQLIFFTIFAHWAKTIGPFGGNFSASLSKLQSKFQEDESHEIRFLSVFSQELLILSKKLSNFSFKNFTGVFEAASYVSRGAMTWGKHVVLELFLLCLDMQIKNFSLSVETSRHCCRKTIYVSRSWVWRKPFFLLFSHEIFILRKKVLAFLVKRCSSVFKAASYVSRGTMNRGKHFLTDCLYYLRTLS